MGLRTSSELEAVRRARVETSSSTNDHVSAPTRTHVVIPSTRYQARCTSSLNVMNVSSPRWPRPATTGGAPLRVTLAASSGPEMFNTSVAPPAFATRNVSGSSRPPSRQLRSALQGSVIGPRGLSRDTHDNRSEEHTSELQSLRHLVCRL